MAPSPARRGPVRAWLGWPEGTFLALAGGEVVGCAGLQPDADEPRRAENALTAVRRDRRGEGIALTLKRQTLAFAAAHGICEVYTWTQRGNDAMRALNERLGYVTRTESVSLVAPLPLPIGPLALEDGDRRPGSSLRPDAPPCRPSA